MAGVADELPHSLLVALGCCLRLRTGVEGGFDLAQHGVERTAEPPHFSARIPLRHAPAQIACGNRARGLLDVRQRPEAAPGHRRWRGSPAAPITTRLTSRSIVSSWPMVLYSLVALIASTTVAVVPLASGPSRHVDTPLVRARLVRHRDGTGFAVRTDPAGARLQVRARDRPARRPNGSESRSPRLYSAVGLITSWMTPLPAYPVQRDVRLAAADPGLLVLADGADSITEGTRQFVVDTGRSGRS